MKKAIYYLMSLMLLCILSGTAIGQQKKTITGSVKDSSGSSIPGVSINLKGTKTTSAADNQGNFKITVPASGGILVFSSIGYKSKEIAADAGDFVAIQLVSEAGRLNEVVVTGFGIRSNTKKLSYAIQEVKGEELARAGTVNVVNSLQGKVSGVMINQGAGGPSSSSRIRIRGNSNITGNTMPLFVIDGVLIQPGPTGADSWGDNRDFGNQLKNLNPMTMKP
jgi:iron complex outermembrane receptor protein